MNYVPYQIPKTAAGGCGQQMHYGTQEREERGCKHGVRSHTNRYRKCADTRDRVIPSQCHGTHDGAETKRHRICDSFKYGTNQRSCLYTIIDRAGSTMRQTVAGMPSILKGYVQCEEIRHPDTQDPVLHQRELLKGVAGTSYPYEIARSVCPNVQLQPFRMKE